MAIIKVDSKAKFQTGLIRRLEVSIDDPIQQFARHFFADHTLNVLNQRHWDDVTDNVRSSWKFYKKFKGLEPRIRIVPAASNHLVIEVASSNQPFLLESIRIELNQSDLVLLDVHQCLMGVVRKSGSLSISDEVEANESLIRMEVETSISPATLTASISEVMDLVSRVVEDFPLMRGRLVACSETADLQSSVLESMALLKWFCDYHFTFLGCEEFLPKKEGGLKIVRGSRLGLAQPNKSADGIPVNIPEGVLNIEKLPVKSRVHRPVYLDSITVCERKAGKVTRLCRFIGLFTATVYNQNPFEIPVVRQKIIDSFARGEIVQSSHRGRELIRIFELLPREELFFATSEDLHRLAMNIFTLQERRIVRVLFRQDHYFANCIVYVPKDTYNTSLRIQIQEVLTRAFHAHDAEFSTYFSESALTRTHFVMRIEHPMEVDVELLEQQITALTRSWNDDLQHLMIESRTGADPISLFQHYKTAFPTGYQADFSVASALEDIYLMEQLSVDKPLGLNLYEKAGPAIHFKVCHAGGALPLSDVIPILENLGAKTIEQHPYEIKRDGDSIWIHNFLLDLISHPDGGIGSLKTIFESAFMEIWRGGRENDSFNRLIPTATLDHRQVSVIRAYARYYGQLQNGSSQQFIADCVTRYPDITRRLYGLFEKRFDPGPIEEVQLKRHKTAGLEKRILLQIAESVVNLADDRVLRGFVEMIVATQRTNYFQLSADGEFKENISFKFLPGLITEMPKPCPAFEIFVYSPRIEGVHLRYGKIARGGLRWSDRTEDYRTEILGLVKAQQVKNSVIVPVGAKGGFLPKQIPEHASRDEVMKEGIACYRIFIQSLLDLTDNLVKGKVVPPASVICYDDEDYYLVVAADKGTATFSDIANGISADNGFWLGDAFASGGSVGYDHKAMGITARGAWKSVQQHFRDRNLDIQKTDFTVIGVGDMSGDVFGNGMLLSNHIRLVAAFNHMHIFVDPEPDTRRCFKERQRLFDLPQSSWSDYDQKLISAGGGVFDRSAKSIRISREMSDRFAINASQLTPNQLISLILKSKVDLFWNGGIGTYVKSRRESHQEVADKANDNIRVNASDLNCQVIGEGGNLGLTQLARVDFCLKGGTCFTDFIDNAGGVNCSDAEVNIKILLNQLVERGELMPGNRKSLLRRMTNEVSGIVLENNYRQAQAVDLMGYQAEKRATEYSQLLHTLEDQGKLNRQLEFLPDEEELQERRSRGQFLTLPEISVLTSYVKSAVKEELVTSALVDDAYISQEMLAAFPPILIKKYGPELKQHRLRRELVATQLTNGMVNFMGINFVKRMTESTGADTERVARAYVVARDVFDLPARWDEICQLDYQVDHQVQKKMMMDVIRLIRRVTRWLIRNRRRALQLGKETPEFRQTQEMLIGNWEHLLAGSELENWAEKRDSFHAAGVPLALSNFVAATHHLYSAMGIVEVKARTGCSTQRIAEIYFELGEALQLNWFSRKIHEYEPSSEWQALARETLQDDLNWQQAALSLGIVAANPNKSSTSAVITRWVEEHQVQVDRWMKLQSQMKLSNVLDSAVFTVGIRELLDLAQSSQGASKKF